MAADKNIKPGPSAVVCILGMHRSGTSCLTGCLEERGLYLGDVVTEAKFNRKGNRENNRLRAVNDDLLAFNGGSWDKPPGVLAWNDDLRRRRDALVAEYRSYARWGFKDPRTLLTLPFWIEAGLEFAYVGTFRHPAAVARSLMGRPGLAPQTDPLRLWTHYNLLLLEYLEEYRFPLVCFDWPAAQYKKAVANVARHFQLDGPRDDSTRFFEEQLRNKSRIDDAAPAVGAEELKIYDALMRRAIDA